jgi:hypothetical protein
VYLHPALYPITAGNLANYQHPVGSGLTHQRSPYTAGRKLSGRSGAILEQLGDALRHLGTLAAPVINAIGIYAQTNFLAARRRVEEADALYKPAIA